MSADPIYQFYTQHPYPPPIDNLDRARDMYQDENVLRSEFHLFWPDKEYRAEIDVLVAGVFESDLCVLFLQYRFFIFNV